LGLKAAVMIKLVDGIAAGSRASRGLVVKVTFEAGDTVHTDFDIVKDTLSDWLRTHGAACGALEIEYEADASSWPQIEQFWINKTTADPLLQALLHRLGKFDLCMLSPAGDNIRRIGFELGASK
jgi:hypothetical protein